MPSIIAPTTARAGECVCPTNVSVGEIGEALPAVWNCAPMDALAMASVKETYVCARKGRYFKYSIFETIIIL